jgi:hypothetical protein
MPGPGTIRAWIVAIIFTVSMLAASVCSTMCEAGVCPYEMHHSAGDACDQMPMGHSSSSHKPAPADQNCSLHHHPNYNLVEADGLPPLQLISVGHLNTHDFLVNSMPRMAPGLAAFSLSDLAPPPTLRSLQQQQTSVLRI